MSKEYAKYLDDKAAVWCPPHKGKPEKIIEHLKLFSIAFLTEEQYEEKYGTKV